MPAISIPVKFASLRRFAYGLIVFTLGAEALHADRWLILPPRVELAKGAPEGGDLARAMALYLKLSRLSQVVQVTEAEGCLKIANVSMAQKIAPESLPAVAEACHAERMLLTRVRNRDGEVEVTTKVFYRESGQLTDTLVTTGSGVLGALGRHLSERFGKAPATVKENSTDLIVAGDTFGGAYFDWQFTRNLLLSLDYVKSAYCLVDHRGTLQLTKPRSDRAEQKQFIEKLRFEGSGSLGEIDGIVACTAKAATLARNEGRKAIILFLVSDFPRDPRAQITARAQIRKLARAGKLLISPASTSTEAALKFWSNIARELSDSAVFLPTAQRVRVGLSTGQEWHIFRRGGRLYESRENEPAQLSGGILIPEKFADSTSPQDLLKVYQAMSGNKVISSGAPDIFAGQLRSTLATAFKPSAADSTAWRVLLDQNGQNFYVSLSPADARRLSQGAYVRIFTELKPPSDKDLLRNIASPSLIVEPAGEVPASIDLNVADYLKAPEKYLRRSLAGRSFYVLSGRVVRVAAPEADALDSGF